jgi:enoyl-CoA hydratase/carnithine racemase
MTASLVLSGRVARITLSRPEVGNLIDFRLAYKLADFAREVRQRDDVWVVVVDADGTDFCMGTDPEALSIVATDESRLMELRVAQAIAEIEKPVVCFIRGRAHDQGLELAMACDLRVADSTAKFAMCQVHSRNMPWDGGTQRLPRLVGQSRALNLLLTGRTLDANEAQEIGLVNEALDPADADRRVTELAETVASHGPTALRYVKEAVLNGSDGPLAHGLRLEADLSFLLQSTRDRREGISSFLERRAPNFRGN